MEIFIVVGGFHGDYQLIVIILSEYFPSPDVQGVWRLGVGKSEPEIVLVCFRAILQS
jgi:hypothetical protein